MTDYTMDVVPKPKEGTKSVIQLKQDGRIPIFKGSANDNYLCGTCKNIICENINKYQVINLVLVCPECKSYNIIRGLNK